MKELSKQIIGTWLLLFAISIPFTFNTIPHPGTWITNHLYPITSWIGESIFGLELVSKATTSDASTLYIQAILLLFIAGLIVVLVRLLGKFSNHQIFTFLHVSATYVLAFFLLKYGFDKLFHFQFYPPEPNTLFTPVGFLSKDILFWSTMGSSGTYNTFMGLIEVLPGILLLFKRTRLLGAFIGLGVLINVFALNIGFDITVKLLSSFLVILSLFVLIPWYRRLGSLFLQLPKSEIKSTELEKSIVLKPLYKRAIKGAMLCLFSIELLLPYINAGNFSGPIYEDTPHHGSYEVLPNDLALLGDSTIRRIHIHSKGYFITESRTGEFKDYPIRNFVAGSSLVFTSEQLEIVVKYGSDHVFFCWDDENGQPKVLSTIKLDLNELPLKDDTYHWTVDGLMQDTKD
ncbi:MAG: hypothetical protein ACI837_000102 [Crocinitomicaceae bacterium]